jgi:hypothetical protein
MAVRLNESGYDHARSLVEDARVVVDERDEWSEHQPSTREENTFIAQHGMRAYARWHLGIDDQQDKDNKGRYKFPYGDFENIHRCALLAAESRAGQRKYTDIQLAAAHLHGMVEEIRQTQSGRSAGRP